MAFLVAWGFVWCWDRSLQIVAARIWSSPFHLTRLFEKRAGQMDGIEMERFVRRGQDKRIGQRCSSFAQDEGSGWANPSSDRGENSKTRRVSLDALTIAMMPDDRLE